MEIYDYNKVKRGDIFIRGAEGYSYGKNGHTGIFTRKGEIIHCNASNNTVTINNENSYLYYYLDCYRSKYERYFRPITKENKYDFKKIKDENWHGLCLSDVNVREYPSTKAKIVASYKKD